MIAERDERYRLICARRGGTWTVELRAGAFWSIGAPDADLDAAIQKAQEKFTAEHPQVELSFGNPPPAPAKKPKTDLSDLFI